MFNDLNVLSPIEIESRAEVALENYILKRQIEARVCRDIAKNHIVPTAINYQNRLLTNVQGLNDVLSASEAKQATKTQIRIIKETSHHIAEIVNTIDKMGIAMDKASDSSNLHDKAIQYAEIVKPMMDIIRQHSDELEMMVDDELWPMPKLRELLFTR